MFDDLNKIVSWLAAGISGLLLWIGKREITRIDKNTDKISKLSDRLDEFLTKEEFNNTIAEWREERREMHEENRKTLSRIHERVDSLWERGK